MYRNGLALTLNVVNKHIYCMYVDLVQMWPYQYIARTKDSIHFAIPWTAKG